MSKNEKPKFGLSLIGGRKAQRSTCADQVSVPVTGRVEIELNYADGRKELHAFPDEVGDANLVVRQAESLMAAMSAGEANSAFNYIELGNPVGPIAPDYTDTGLERPVPVIEGGPQQKSVAITRATKVVTCEAVWAVGDGNGITYTEAGLFTGPFGAGTMFARKLIGSITKTGAFSMTFRWILTFNIPIPGSDGCQGVALIGNAVVVTQEQTFVAVGGETEISATFDFVVGDHRTDLYLNGVHLIPATHYVEMATLPISGLKGFDFTGAGIVLKLGDVIYLKHLNFS